MVRTKAAMMSHLSRECCDKDDEGLGVGIEYKRGWSCVRWGGM